MSSVISIADEKETTWLCNVVTRLCSLVSEIEIVHFDNIHFPSLELGRTNFSFWSYLLPVIKTRPESCLNKKMNPIWTTRLSPTFIFKIQFSVCFWQVILIEYSKRYSKQGGWVTRISSQITNSGAIGKHKIFTERNYRLKEGERAKQTTKLQ